MRRQTLLLFLAVSVIGIQSLINCAKPLESGIVIPDPDPNPVIEDTIFITDTVVTVDTIFIGADTTIIYDTIFVNDTIVVVNTIVDTIIVIDTLAVSPTYCASLSSYQKTITWMLQNHAGRYRLEFVASGDNNDPKQKLTIMINDEEYEWRPFDNPELVLGLDLNEDARALIYSTNPHAFGHALDICLKVEKR